MTDSVRPHRQQPTKLLLSLGFSRQEYRSGLPFPSPMHESEKWKWNRSVVPDSWWPHGLQPTRLFRPWDFQGKSTGVGCHCLLRSAHYRLCKNGGRLPCIDLNGIPRGGASRSRCKVKFLKQGAGYPWGLCAGHLHWTPLVDLEAVLSPVPWGLCNLFSFFFFFFLFSPLVSCTILTKPRTLRFSFSLTMPTAVPSRSAPREHAPNSASRPIRLQARTPGSQSSVAAGSWRLRRRLRTEEASSPRASSGLTQGPPRCR